MYAANMSVAGICIGFSLAILVLVPFTSEASREVRKSHDIFDSLERLSANHHITTAGHVRSTGHTSRSTEDIYLGICSEEEYVEWYSNEYPLECRDSFSNASNLHELFQVYCDPFCGRIYFNYLDDCGNAGVILTAFYTNLCTINEHGVGCYNYITSDNYPNSKPTVDEYCFPVNSSCTTECHHALESLSANLGCCVNTLYNQSIPHPAADYELWANCGLSTPSYCNQRSVSGSSSLASKLNMCSLAVVLFVAAVLKQN